jgi:hypothetical protein
MISINRNRLLHEDFKKKKLTVFFNRDQCQIMGYVNNFYVRSVSVCQEWVYLFMGDEPIKEVYHQKKINFKIVPAN